MNQITVESLEFMQEAKEVFEKHPDLTTYRDDKEDFIALRSGLFEDSIVIYELGSQIGIFVQQLPRQQKVLIDYDEHEKLKRMEKKIEISRYMMQLISSLTDSPEIRNHCASTLVELTK